MRYESLKHAIKNLFEPNVSDEITIFILNFFGYSDQIVDNILSKSERDLFYILEDYGIVKTEREEIKLFDGTYWRIHYWSLDWKRIGQISKKKAKQTEKDYNEVYNSIPESVWKRENAKV